MLGEQFHGADGSGGDEEGAEQSFVEGARCPTGHCSWSESPAGSFFEHHAVRRLLISLLLEPPIRQFGESHMICSSPEFKYSARRQKKDKKNFKAQTFRLSFFFVQLFMILSFNDQSQFL